MESNGFATVADGRQSPWKLWVGCAQAMVGFVGSGCLAVDAYSHQIWSFASKTDLAGAIGLI